MSDSPDNGVARAGRKWVRGLAPEAPAGDAARLVVGERLRRPGEMLQAVVADHGRTPEKVHQLRVATRRAQSALEAFAPLLDEKACAKARRAMKRIRRAAGPARICDVHLELFGQRVQAAAASRCAAIGFVLGHIAVERAAAQLTMVQALGSWPDERLERLRARATAEVTQGVETFEVFGARAVEASTERMQVASRANLRAFENLHELRKAAKAVRYTLEIFRECTAPEAFDQLYGHATEVQRRLGDLNDAHEMLERVRRAMDSGVVPAPVAPALAELRAQLERERDLARDRFLDWWSADRAPRPVVVAAPAQVEAAT